MFRRREYHMSYQEKKLEGRIAAILCNRGARESCWNKHLGHLSFSTHPGPSKPPAASQPNSPHPRHTYPTTRMADDISRVKYSCSQVAETVSDETKQLDFYFLYKIDTEVDDDAKVELNRLQVAYVYNLASKLLPCADSEDADEEDISKDHLFTVVAIDSAKEDEVLEIGETQTMEIVASSRFVSFVSPRSIHVFISLDRTLRRSKF